MSKFDKAMEFWCEWGALLACAYGLAIVFIQHGSGWGVVALVTAIVASVGGVVHSIVAAR